jgi:hypothetical protein
VGERVNWHPHAQTAQPVALTEGSRSPLPLPAACCLPAPMPSPPMLACPPQLTPAGEFDGQAAPYFQSPWMSGMYVGQLDSLKGGIYPGWKPNRDPKSKW